MGTMTFNHLAPLSSFLNKNAAATNPLQPASETNAAKASATSPAGDTLGTDREQQIANQYAATVYRSQTQQVSLSARFQEVAARFADTADGQTATAGSQAQQLTFDFFAESRSESLAQFSQRTQDTAGEVQGAQRQTYLELSQKVSARFKFSMDISGEALTGFTNAADSTQSSEDLFNQFLAFANQLLGAANDAFNEFFSLLSGSVSDKPDNQSQDMIQKMLDQFAASIGNLFSNGSGGNGTSSSSVSVNINVQMEFGFEISAAGAVQQSDPIVLDLNGDGIQLTNYADGAKFDLLGDGRKVNAAMVTGGDAFLAIDRNGDGAINSGKELFGDQNGAINGYEELRKMDSNGDGVIDRSDRDYAKLLLWRDNGDGVSDPSELISLADAGIEEISLQYRNVNMQASGGNRIAQVAHFRRSDGSYGSSGDAILNYTV